MNHASLSPEILITKVIRCMVSTLKDAFWVWLLKRKLRKLIASPLSNNLFVRKEAFSIQIFGQ